MSTLRRIREESEQADALLAQLASSVDPAGAGAANDPPAGDPEPVVTDPAANAPAPAQAAAQTPAPAAPAAAPPADDWAQRYRTLQGMHQAQSAELSELRGKMSTMEALVARMMSPTAAAPAADARATSHVTEAERAEFGDDLLSFVQRAARDEWLPRVSLLETTIARLQASLQQVGTTVQQTSAAVAETASDKFYSYLDKHVGAEWKVINKDPKFLDWLQEPDKFSGVKRNDLFLNAANQLDAPRISEFFKAYATHTGMSLGTASDGANTRAPSGPAVDPQSLVTPGTAAPAQTNTGATKAGKVWTRAEVTELYDRKTKGKISPAEFAAKERDLQLAMTEGRVTN